MIPKEQFIKELEKAKQGSIEHWVEIVEHPTRSSSGDDCDLCKFYSVARSRQFSTNLLHSVCPLSPTIRAWNRRKENDNCCMQYHRWGRNKTKANAQKVLDRIKAIDVEAFADKVYNALEEGQ